MSLSSGKDIDHMNSPTYYFDLIVHLVRCDFHLRYKGSVLGILWSLMLPLAQLLVLVFLFQRVIPLKIDDYPAFVFSALLPWSWFSNCMSGFGGLFISNRNLIWRPNFAPVNLIIVNTLSNLFIFLVQMPILAVVMFFYGRDMTCSLLIVPLLILIQGILLVGLGMIVATLNVFYRDVQHIVGVALMLLFYLTPVFYWSEDVSENYRVVYLLNPIAVLIQGYRAVFFYGTAPEWLSFLLLSGISAAICGLGYLIYRRQLHKVIDTI